MQKEHTGWPSAATGKLKAFVVRVPANYIDKTNQIQRGAFQTVVMAPSEIMAWETAIACDIWEKLPFDIQYVRVFPKEVSLCTNKENDTNCYDG